MQNIRNKESVYEGKDTLLLRTSGASESCLNITIAFEFYDHDLTYTPRLPFSIDNGVSAYTFDKYVPIPKARGHVYNFHVMSIMVLLGLSIRLLSDTSFTDAFLGLSCAVSSSGQCSTELKNDVAIAAFVRILGNMFFSLILVDDMTSTIIVPGSFRLSRLEGCATERLTVDSRDRYIAVQTLYFWKLVADLVDYSNALCVIICASQSEADDLRRFFDFQNLYHIPLESYGRKWIIRPRVGRKTTCPSRTGVDGCEFVRSFVDTAEWNAYAMIMLHFDLAKAPVSKQLRNQIRGVKTTIKARHGKENRMRQIAKYLSKFEGRYRERKQENHDFPTTFLLISFHVILVVLFLEFSLVSLARRAHRAGPYNFCIYIYISGCRAELMHESENSIRSPSSHL